jgi:3-hydroxyisobutyrate dehydrogenase-like beta-hydroxyacid dehydrogenase
VRTVGLLGLGLLGGALADRLTQGGLRVIAYDPRAECREQLRATGGVPADSAASVVEAVDVLLLSLPDGDVVRGVVEELGERLRGKTILDTTTGDPDSTAELGRRLAGRGTAYLDVTVVGSSRLVRAGDVVVLVGGEAETVRDSEEVIHHFARQWFHLGPWGSGARAKLVVNLVLGLNRAVLAEGLAFARRTGLDADVMLEVLRSGAAYSRVMDAKGRKMLDGDFTPEARLSQHLKDVRLILAAGRRCGAKLPLSGLHGELLTGLEADGLGDFDNSAVLRAFEA